MPKPSHPLEEIKDALAHFVSAEKKLALEELKPAAKHAGISAGLFAGAGLFLFHAIWMLVIVLGLALGLLLHALTPLGPWGSFTLGFTISLLLSVIFAVVLILVGRRQWRKVRKPEATIAEAKATLDAVVHAITSRNQSDTLVVEPQPQDEVDSTGR